MLRRTSEQQQAFPGRRARILIEDAHLATASVESPSRAFEIVTCSGPEDEREECPLVADGTCPEGPFDVVVSALDGPWARPVCAAWQRSTTPVVDATGVTTTDPAERLEHHVGAALRVWFGPDDE